MELPQNLRSLVSQSVALLGQIIERELGKEKYQRIEALRVAMTELRGCKGEEAFQRLQKQYRELQGLKSQELHEIASSFTLMLELMNTCENAYRSYRLSQNKSKSAALAEDPNAIVYVLTAHPTEARAPQNIKAFHAIQEILIRILDGEEAESELVHAIEVSWRCWIVRMRKPTVKDEAEHVYSLLFRDNVLFSLLNAGSGRVPFYVRSWVGGDKDGHPGVDDKTLLQSLSLSREMILKSIHQELSKIRETLSLFHNSVLRKDFSKLEKNLLPIRSVGTADAKKILVFRKSLSQFKKRYQDLVGAVHPNLQRLGLLVRTFPALVVPLELRESSDILMGTDIPRKKLSIFKMLIAIERISRGGNPRWYARGFIISMAGSVEHIQAAASFQKDVFKDLKLPIIPLFEEAASLKKSPQIIADVVKDPILKKAAIKNWDGMLEMMVGYSDSSKESGVLASRLAISEALPRLEEVCREAQLTPIFFHGSGGSVDRGGGSIEDQIAWWP
jgi:phosphoenolpyruvate carboxylase